MTSSRKSCSSLPCSLQATESRNMAFVSAISLPSLFVHGNKAHFRNLRKIPVSSLAGRHRFKAVVTRAVGDSSDSSSGSIVKYVQSAWNSPEDRIALAGLGFAAIVAFWASANLIAAIDKLPVIPSTLEFIGILFSWWFIYRYLLFKPGREELVTKIKTSLSDIIGQ